MRTVTLVLGCFATLFLTISVATIGWLSAGGVNYGLWQAEANGVTVDLDDVDDKIEATRAMMLIAVLAAAAGAILVGVKMAKPALLAFVVAGISGLIGIAVFASYQDDELDGNGDLDYSFALGVIGFLLSFASAGAATKVE